MPEVKYLPKNQLAVIEDLFAASAPKFMPIGK